MTNTLGHSNYTAIVLIDYILDSLCQHAQTSTATPGFAVLVTLYSVSLPGLLADSEPESNAECCDVRWDSKPDNRSRGTLKRTSPSCDHQGASVTSAAAPRLCNGRLKLCLLVLVLLHTVVTITTSHNSTGVSVTAIFSLEESSPSEE